MTETAGATPRKQRLKRGLPIVRVVLLFAIAGVVYWLLPEPKPPLVIPVTEAVAEWPAYGGDAGGTRYSALDQITPGNVMHLEQAWVYRTGEDYTDTEDDDSAAFEATPIVVDGVMYLSTPSNRVIALDPETGMERWVYDPKINLKDGSSEMTSRGVSTWPAPEHAPEGDWSRKIFFGTLDARLICLEAASGAPCAAFGNKGEVDLRAGARVMPNQTRVHYLVTSPPAIVRDLVIVGSAIGDNRAVELERGIVRAYDARTGAQVWSWDPIPTGPGHPAWNEWEPAQAAKTGAANAWSILSVDAERDLVFVPTGSASPDYYGGERKGSNLYANSTVALRASTGEVVWAFQSVHHDLWDYDVPAQPVLMDVTRDGRRLPAVVQATKMGHVFFFHRDTGEPLFPIEERPVPESDVEGEAAWPTQPFPVVTPPLVPQTLKPEDAWGLTPIDRGMARKKLEGMRSDGLFTPPSLQGSVHYPGVAGGTNWGSVAFDPAREVVIMNTSRVAFGITLFPRDTYDIEKDYGDVERGRQEGTPYVMHREPLISPLGLPVSPPPWGMLTAVSTATGEIVWESVLGTPRDIAPVPIAFKWGTPNMGGPIATKSGLVFISATMDYYLRAFDTATGTELWKGRLPAGGQATPMTFRLKPDGKQYVVICAGGHGKMGTKLGDYVIAYALPDKK
jgi:quinoprotein glucose dehydrogenase